MSPTLRVYVCRYYHAEVSAAIAALESQDVTVETYALRCDRPVRQRMTLGGTAPMPEATNQLFIGVCALAPDSARPPPPLPERAIRLDHCLTLLSGPTPFKQALHAGAYLVTPGWLRQWPEHLQHWGFDQALAREFFRDTVSELLLLDTGIDPEAPAELERFAAYVQRPYQVRSVGLDYLQLLLERAILTWRLEHTKSEAQRTAQQANRKSADYAMAFDLLVTLAELHSEEETINAIMHMARRLFGSMRLAYGQVRGNQIVRVYALPETGTEHDRLSQAWAMLGKSSTLDDGPDGFYLRIQHRRETFGLLAVSGIIFPEHRYQYLNLGLALANLCGLALANALDVAKRQEAAEELGRARDAAEAAAQARASFLATMSHEIRTPLNAIIGMTTLLQTTALSDDQLHMINTISTAGQTLLAVINDILDFSRIESGPLELESQPFDLHASLRATSALVEHMVRQKGLAFELALSALLPAWVAGDEMRLRQVLLNLLSNAVKFTSAGGITLHASAQPLDGERQLICISVRDTGIGLSAAQQQRIFEPFVQADSSTARRYGGTGLGLAISSQLVQLMGGTLTVESQLAAGATFTLHIPMQVVAAPLAMASPVASFSAEQPLDILIAEDNAINQEILQRILERMGHRVAVVSNGQEAIDIIAQWRFDMIFMDIEMPIMDGEEATRQIRARRIKQPYIIALTAHATTSVREQALRAGMNDYLTKPIQLAELERALRLIPTASEVSSMPAYAKYPLVDWAKLKAMCAAVGQDQAMLLADLISNFEQTMHEQISKLEAALAVADHTAVQQITHRMRGGCLQLNLQALVSLCTQIETEAANLTTRAPLIAQLRPCYAQTLAALRRGDTKSDSR